MTTDTWSPTGKTWGTNSRPFEVTNQNNLRGVAKPGEGIADNILRAAHEKIASDLAYILGLPVAPVILWDRGESFARQADRFCAISAWAFSKPLEWQHYRPSATAEQTALAVKAAGAMQVFDTWVAAVDRKDDHVLVSDDENKTALSLAYIDYAFALSYEWTGAAAAQADPRPAWPSGITACPIATNSVVSAIETLDEQAIGDIVKRVPSGYFLGNAQTATIENLLRRREQLRGLFNLAPKVTPP